MLNALALAAAAGVALATPTAPALPEVNYNTLVVSALLDHREIAPCTVEDGSDIAEGEACIWKGSDPSYGNGIGLTYIVLHHTDGAWSFAYADGHVEHEDA